MAGTLKTRKVTVIVDSGETYNFCCTIVIKHFKTPMNLSIGFKFFWEVHISMHLHGVSIKVHWCLLVLKVRCEQLNGLKQTSTQLLEHKNAIAKLKFRFHARISHPTQTHGTP